MGRIGGGRGGKSGDDAVDMVPVKLEWRLGREMFEIMEDRPIDLGDARPRCSGLVREPMAMCSSAKHVLWRAISPPFGEEDGKV